MAENPTTFETKPPTQYTKEGVNLRDLLRFATGKAEGEDVTPEDFNNLLSTSGVRGKDARNLTKAFNTINKNQNLDYLLSTKGDSFNVFDKTTGEALTKSSRKTGSTKGVTLADLIGLGNNVSTLAGFSANRIGDYLKNKAELTSQDERSLPKYEEPGQNPNAVAPTASTVPPVAKPSIKKPVGKSSSAPKQRPLDPLLKNDGMRQWLLNPQTPTVPGTNVLAGEDGLPQVDLPKIDGASAKIIQKNAEQESERINQKNYTNELYNNYRTTFDYLAGKVKSNTDKLRVSADLRLLKQRNPSLHSYLLKHHSQQLNGLYDGNN